MQSASSRIWTRVAVSISYDDNHYTTGTSFKNVINEMCLEIIFLKYMNKNCLALNNRQWLIRHKTKPNQNC